MKYYRLFHSVAEFSIRIGQKVLINFHDSDSNNNAAAYHVFLQSLEVKWLHFIIKNVKLFK